MLNEFVILEQGLTAAGFSITSRHPDVQSPGKSAALHVRLGAKGTPTEIGFLAAERIAKLWTLRNGKHNSFPYMQFKQPFLSVPQTREWHAERSESWRRLSLGDRRRELRHLAADFPVVGMHWDGWPGPSLKTSLASRIDIFSKSDDQTREVTALIQRFIRAVEEPESFIRNLAHSVIDGLEDADDELLNIVITALVGTYSDPDKKAFGAPIYFDVARNEFPKEITHSAWAGLISEVLTTNGITREGYCDLTGRMGRLHVGNFPQPSLPVLGQVYLFAKNGDIPAAHRYGRADDEAIKVDTLLAQRIAGALDAITAIELKGKTWRSIPGERAKDSDLFLAFVDQAMEAALADMMAGTEDAGYEPEVVDDSAALDRASFQKRAERVIEAIKGKTEADFRKTPVTFCILRKVDSGNAKVILYRTSTVGEIYDAATGWRRAQDNLPDWLTLPVPTKQKTINNRQGLAVAPLQLPRMTRTLFFRGASEQSKKEPIGITSQDAFSLFLGDSNASRIARATLALVLRRQAVLLIAVAQARCKDSSKPKFDAMLKLDKKASHSALGSAAVVGLLLAMLGRRREVYMSEAAFKLGQLLAVVDVVHVGYCVDVRGGGVPPTLLGNSVLAVAQSNPIRALGLISRRWKPYAAWARNPNTWSKGNALKQINKNGGIAILNAISQARRANEVVQSLHGLLPSTTDDTFRAELLLGYMAGLPAKAKDIVDSEDIKGEEDNG